MQTKSFSYPGAA